MGVSQRASRCPTGARDLYRRTLTIWQDLSARGTLSPTDRPKLDLVERELARCDRMLAPRWAAVGRSTGDHHQIIESLRGRAVRAAAAHACAVAFAQTSAEALRV
jgi:hypothetical protein